MRAFVYLKITDNNNFIFENKMINWVKSKIAEVVCFDLDGSSSAEIFQYAQQLLTESTHSIIMVESNGTLGLTKAVGWIEKNIKKDNLLKIVLFGSSTPYLQVLLKKYPQQIIAVNSETESKNEVNKIWN